MITRAPNPIGPIVNGDAARLPSHDTKLTGRYITIVGLSPQHADAFYPHISGPENAHLWDYMFDGPYHDPATFRANIGAKAVSQDPVFYAIIPNDRPTISIPISPAPSTPAGREDEVNNVIGLASYLRIEPNHRCIEVGNIMFAPSLQRTPAATEAMYLLARHALEDLGYRRYEWKCHALNAPSRRAALRLGFAFEGVFRKHMVIKGRSRDTAWFAVTDEEWPAVKAALEAWLDPANFGEDGAQGRRLEEFRG